MIPGISATYCRPRLDSPREAVIEPRVAVYDSLRAFIRQRCSALIIDQGIWQPLSRTQACDRLPGRTPFTSPPQQWVRSEAFKHDLAPGLAALQQGMCALEIFGIDGAEGLRCRGGDLASVQQTRHLGEDLALTRDISGGEQ